MAPKRKREDCDNLSPTREPNRGILIAVDFGTTFSGLGFASTRQPEKQIPITQWPTANSEGLDGKTQGKVPTELRYNGQDYKWGCQIDDADPRHQWFKLDLDPSQKRSNDLATMYPDPVAAPPSYEHSAEDLTTDFLTALRKHAEHVLSLKLPQSALKSTPIEYILTVPAVWSDLAQAKTRKCAEKAGMGKGSGLQLVSEPEAAAIYALADMDPLDLRIGDIYVLCDAGGGTVDLITYEITALKPNIKVTEAVHGTGGLCGGSFLNRRFESFMEKKLGDEPGWDKTVLEDAIKYFEDTVKKDFCGTFAEKFFIPIPGMMNNTNLGISRGKLRLAGTDIRSIFEPVLSEVVALVMDQVKATTKPIKAVLMVGGFGQNAYLRDLVRREIRTQRHAKDAEVLVPKDGWTAVVQGALLKGLASTSRSFSTIGISGRKARRHYGTTSSKNFSAIVHDYTKRHWDSYEGKYMISTMDWFVRKADLVEEEKSFRLAYFFTRLVSTGTLGDYETPIYTCIDPHNTGAPMYKNSDVDHLVDVKADLSRIPEHKLVKRLGKDGRLYYNISFEIQITHYSACTTYELIHNGENLGEVTAEFV